MTMIKRWRWALAVAIVVAVVAGPWATRRVEACGGIGFFSINCDGIIIANQMVQIGHMVSQINQMVRQLSSLDGVLSMTTELVGSDDIGMGNIGRVREVTDAEWLLGRHGIGLSTSAGKTGVFSQRIPGVTDATGWLSVLAPAETPLLGTRPATEVGAELAGAFASWLLPDEGANLAVLEALQEMGSGTRSYRTVWDDMNGEGSVAPLLTTAQLEALSDDVDTQEWLRDTQQRAEAQASAALVHAHAEADAASFLAQQVGEASAALADLRQDDLMRTQRVSHAQLAASMAGTELAVAHAQLAAYEAAREARERYEAERARRAARAEWQAGMVAGSAAWVARAAADAATAGDRQEAHRYFPSASDWTW